jgi:adenine phosphoribosyltransferase
MDRLTQIRQAIRDVPDFPKKGILFKDITPVLCDSKLFSAAIELLAEKAATHRIDAVAAVEARGFILGSALAQRLGRGFIPIRKPGKLPYKTYRESYDLEYGTDALEIHQDAIHNGQRVLLIDDLLATGGTALAAAKLIGRCGGYVEMILVLVELDFLHGRQKLKEYSAQSLISY